MGFKYVGIGCIDRQSNGQGPNESARNSLEPMASVIDSFKPHLLTLLGDTVYHDRPGTITYPANPAIATTVPAAELDTVEDYRNRWRQLFLMPGMQKIMNAASNIHYYTSDHDWAMNDMDGRITYSAPSNPTLNIADQEDYNTVVEFIDPIYRDLVSGNMDLDPVGLAGQKVNINNPTPPALTAEPWPWLYDAVNNGSYTGSIPSKATLQARGAYDPIYGSQGYKYSGIIDDLNPDVLVINLDTTRERDASFLSPIPEANRLMISQTQEDWCIDLIENTSADWILLTSDKPLVGDVTGLSNNDGIQNYLTWRDAFFARIAATGKTGIINVASDMHRPFICSVPLSSQDANYPLGVTSVCNSPFNTNYTGTGNVVDSDLYWINEDPSTTEPRGFSTMEFGPDKLTVKYYEENQIALTAYMAKGTNYLRQEEPKMGTETNTYQVANAAIQRGFNHFVPANLGSLISGDGLIGGNEISSVSQYNALTTGFQNSFRVYVSQEGGGILPQDLFDSIEFTSSQGAFVFNTADADPVVTITGGSGNIPDDATVWVWPYDYVTNGDLFNDGESVAFDFVTAEAGGSPTLTTPYSIGTNNGPLFTIKTSDTLATIEAAGFFDGNAAYASLLKTGDVVLIEASNGTKFYNVTVEKISRTITLSTGTEIQ